MGRFFFGKNTKWLQKGIEAGLDDEQQVDF